jgi:poly(A) polymerase
MLKVFFAITPWRRTIKEPETSHPASFTDITPLSYDKTTNKWVHSVVHDSSPPPTTLKIATHNVLLKMGWLEIIIRSEERFAKEMQVLKELDADVIALNEVTAPFMKLLQEQDWVQDKYYISDCVTADNNAVNHSVPFHNYMGNVIISRVPFKTLRFFTFSSTVNLRRNAIVGTFFDNDTVICSAHITAYEECVARRVNEMNELTRHLPQKNVIILGDLNLHLVSENSLITDVGYEDLWKPTKEDPDGFTWDTQLNPMITKFLILDRRRMRLDRIIAKEGCDWECDENGVEIFAKEPVYEGSYLACSDHFGLKATLKLN